MPCASVSCPIAFTFQLEELKTNWSKGERQGLCCHLVVSMDVTHGAPVDCRRWGHLRSTARLSSLGDRGGGGDVCIKLLVISFPFFPPLILSGLLLLTSEP